MDGQSDPDLMSSKVAATWLTHGCRVLLTLYFGTLLQDSPAEPRQDQQGGDAAFAGLGHVESLLCS